MKHLLLISLVFLISCSKKEEYKHFKFKYGQKVIVNESKSLYSNCEGSIYNGFQTETEPMYIVTLYKCPNIKNIKYNIHGGEEYFIGVK